MHILSIAQKSRPRTAKSSFVYWFL